MKPTQYSKLAPGGMTTKAFECDSWRRQGFVSYPTHPDHLFALPGILADRYWKLFPWGQSRPSMKLIIHLCLVLKLRIHGAVHPLPPCLGTHFCTGTDLPLTLVCWKDTTLILLIIINEQFQLASAFKIVRYILT
jgi:hypothetical protein